MDRVNKENSHLKIEELFEVYPVLKQILPNILQVVWILELGDDKILYVSPAFETVWGRSCESLYQDPSTLIKSVHPEDRVMVMSASLDDKHKTSDQSYRILRPDGSLRWISAHTFLVSDQSADTFFEICVAQDITNQSQVDLTLQKALDRSREQFTLSRRMSLARKPEMVLKTLMSASELHTAKQALVLFFKSPPGRPIYGFEVITTWISETSQSDHNLNELFIDTNLFEKIAISNLFHPSRPVVLSEISKDQRLTPQVREMLVAQQIQSMTIFPLVALGNWLGCLIVFFPVEKYFETVGLRQLKVLVDQASITLHNLRLLEIEAESRHEAEKANEIKTRFLAMITHELRTPLTSIKGFTNTLLAEDVAWEPEEQRDFIQTIEQEANRLQELIDQLLDLSRLEAGMLPITQAFNSLDDILADAMPQLRVLTQKHSLALRLPANLPPVFVDAKRIAQVIVNLVRNAAMYSPDGTEIFLTARVHEGFVQINVNDQGPGIPPGDRKQVFQAFRRGENVENHAMPGAGLGLAVCKGLVEAHGGRIWIKQKTTPGATVSFTIPLFLSQVKAMSSDKA